MHIADGDPNVGRHVLYELTLEELWELFPIQLVPYDEEWARMYEDILPVLRCALQPFSPSRISHIGSTAIQGIWSKPIVDVLVEFETPTNLIEAGTSLEKQGEFLTMSRSAHRVSLNAGYTENGFAEKVYHVHLRYAGDNDELYFRDYLCAHPDAAILYQELKLNLWKQFPQDRDAYTAAKTDFVSKYTRLAKEQFGGRYACPEKEKDPQSLQVE